MKKILHELNYLKFKNILHIFIFLFAIPFSLFYKIIVLIFKKKIWLICEDEMEARDNGFCFFEYLNMNHPEITSYYAINKKSKDYNKVKSTGKAIKYGGLKHWIYYFNCKYNISSQKAGNPDAAICYVLERIGLNKNKNVFLQHGITINKAEWLFYKNSKIRLFICGAKPEYDYILKYFGYPKNYVCYTGFNRFDYYHENTVNKKQVVLMPSWREWIASKNEFSNKFEDTSDFRNTEYYKRYKSLINNKELIDFLEKNDIKLYFYPHRNMQKYIEYFDSKSKNIIIVSNNDIDIKDLLIKSALMITDYSSVAMDFAYMKKPVIYYQFDEERFRKAQYEKGYFDYRKDGFGNVVINEDDVIKCIIDSYNNGFKLKPIFEKKHDVFFPLYDNHNCDRIYNVIKRIK